MIITEVPYNPFLNKIVKSQVDNIPFIDINHSNEDKIGGGINVYGSRERDDKTNGKLFNTPFLSGGATGGASDIMDFKDLLRRIKTSYRIIKYIK